LYVRMMNVQVVGIVGGLGLPWIGSFGLVACLYFYSHYLFASGAAHIGAMYTAFLSVSIACGAPALPAALFLAQISNLMGCLTPYGIGSAPPYFAAGYVPQSKWYLYGFICSVYYLAVWFIVGGAWWKFIGLL
jgi:di/tricarboxylate transporter